MATFAARLGRQTALPAAASFALHQYKQKSACDAPQSSVADDSGRETHSKTAQAKPPPQAAGMRSWEEGDFHGFFPKRQLWQPKLEYPLWDNNWDGKHPVSTGDPEADRTRMRDIRKTGVTRHIILIRHGQYDETQKEDSKRVLTPLGRQQADLTGKRLAEMAKGFEKEFGPCKINIIRVSNMARAKETANIIARHLPEVELAPPDPLLNEARPAHTIPGGKASDAVIEKTSRGHETIEAAFQKYFYRADTYVSNQDTATPEEEHVPETEDTKVALTQSKHEFEIIVCHANVIRYFLCRALQIPPEAWLRLCTFNCSLTYLTIRPTGTVSCRMLGDIGHLPYGKSTFSSHLGYNW